MACLRRHNQGKVILASKVPSHLVDSIEVSKHIETSGLLVEQFTITKVDLFRPLHGLNHTVLHVKLTYVDQHLNTLLKQGSEHPSRVLIPILQRSGHSLVCF